MVKGHSQSSASSATRKKHQKKAAVSLGIDLDATASPKSQPGKPKNKEKSGRGKKDGKKEPKVKVYIPPVKPTRAQPDPLEVGGLARRLPPELVVVLRNVGKKAQITKIRALEELGTAWVEKALGRSVGTREDGGASDISMDVLSSLVEMIPAWMHYVPSLFVHPSRRVRLLAISVHLSLLKVPEIRDQLLFHLQETATSEASESILGTWCVLAHDIEKAVSSVGKEAWDSFVRNRPDVSEEEPTMGASTEKYFVLDATSRNTVFGFLQRIVLDPLGVYAYLNPPPASSVPTPPEPPNPKNRRPGGGNKGAAASKQHQLAAAIAAARKAGIEDGEPARNKSEEYDESESDRSARLRIGGVGGLRWLLDSDIISEEVMILLKSPLFWSLLHHAEKAPFLPTDTRKDFDSTESFGYGHPNVRKAGWGLLMKLLESYKEHITPILPVLSSAVLRSAWVEPDGLVQGLMWQPLLTFIKDFPSCWDMESRKSYDGPFKDEDGDDANDESDESDGEGKESQENYEKLERPPEADNPSLAYQDFLQFLQLGCSGSPVQGYPTVVVILSTIPSSVIASSGSKTPLEDLFTSLWAALDGRALNSLHRFSASAAFLSALLECVVFMTRRLILDSKRIEDRKGSVLASSNVQNIGEDARSLVREHFGRVWQELKSGRLKVEERAAARLVAQNLDALNKVDLDIASGQGGNIVLRDEAWKVIESGSRSATRTNPSLVAVFLKVLFDHFQAATTAKRAVGELIYTVLEESVQTATDSLQTEDRQSIKEAVKFLECMLEQFREGLFDRRVFAQRFDELVQTQTSFLFEASPPFLFAYLVHRKHEEDVLGLWYSILNVIVTNAHDVEKTRKLAMEVVQIVQNGGLPRYLKPKSNELDDVVGHLLGGVLNGGLATDANLDVVKAVLGAHHYFISEAGYASFVEAIATAVTLRVELLIGGSNQVDFDLAVFCGPIELLDLVASQATAPMGRALEDVLLNVFLFGYLIPQCAAYEFDTNSHVFTVARGIWRREGDVQKLGKETSERITASVKMKIRDLLIDTQVQPLPSEILGVLSAQAQKLRISILDDIFPSPEALNGMLRRLSHNPINPSLAVIDFLIPTDADSPAHGPQDTDSRGFSAYARIVEALLRVFLEDRKLAKQNIWALRHFIALSIYASDYQKVPAGTSPVFESKALSELSDLVVRIHQITAYLFPGSLSGAEDSWRRGVIKRAGAVDYSGGGSQLENLVVGVMGAAVESDAILDTRVLKVVLEAVLEDVEKEEAEEWMGFARKLERTAPEASMAVVSAITETKAEPLRLDRYRNEQAAELLGIKPSRVNSDGLLTLRRLAASAPNLESDVVFLSQNRAVNVIKACQGWVSSDEADVSEEVESAMTLIFVYLAPILQNVSGSHWEFIWDVLENNLENSSITDDNTLTTLIRSLRLVIIIEDLVKANKPLRSEWDHRRKNMLEMIRDVALIRLDSVSPSLPRSICRELVLTVLQELPESSMDENTLPQMCHLVTDHSLQAQKMAYGIMRSAAKKRTEYLVVEAGVDTESTRKATLPSELLDIVQRHVDVINLEDEDEQQSIFSSLLGWMLVFDLFQDASFKVKSEYIEQLRDAELISTSFIPLFLALLRLDGGLEKAFKLNVWAIDDFYIDLFELGSPISIHLLAAHLYYRALLSVPALIYSWLSNCKDRQLSSALTSYTSQYFSPIIIDVELAHVKGPAGQELADDSMSIKVATVVNEVLASYLVDEHQLEIKLKIPPDWPLHKIEVKDIKRVGVDNDRWRAWILAVQQTIWSHNGRITDGLSLFKKNVTLHFEGQVECAICYSIISVMDGSLPKKPCKTCKNKFHAGCLFKWFHTSNASTCPLCRSEIILA